jgi:hypothetical protein
MSLAEPLEVESQAPRPRRPHAAVAGLVGGPYPNLGSDLRRARPRLVAAGTADDSPEAVQPLAGSRSSGPYPNLPTTRR